MRSTAFNSKSLMKTYESGLGPCVDYEHREVLDKNVVRGYPGSLKPKPRRS
jgi:hypothetical protein